jgi:hypothetical protein
MKANINPNGSIEIQDGTPEEVFALSLLMADKSPFSSSKPSATATDSIVMSEDVAFRVLKRRPLSEAQAKLLALLLRNGSAWSTAKELQKATKYNPSQLAGLFGAFGKRVTGTEGFIEGTSFFEWEWDYEVDCYKYRLPADVLKAVARVDP